MKIQNYDRQLNKLQTRYGLSFVSAINVLECVEAFKKYDRLPQASRDAVQVICDLFNVSLIFHQTKSAIVLTGIFEPLGVSFLYHDAKTVSAFCRGASEFHLHPGADNQLLKV